MFDASGYNMKAAGRIHLMPEYVDQMVVGFLLGQATIGTYVDNYADAFYGDYGCVGAWRRIRATEFC